VEAYGREGKELDFQNGEGEGVELYVEYMLVSNVLGLPR
jgi:hypothetical protein